MANISTSLADWSSTASSNQPDSSDTNTIQADLQAIQAAVKTAFPNVTGAVTPTHTELNYVDGVTSAIQTQLDTLTTNVGNKAAKGANGDITSLTACTNITALAVTVASDDKVLIQDTSDSDKLKTVAASSLAASAASETVAGVVELATDAETQTGTDTARAITPANLAASVLGVTQTWQDVTASRAAATNYTNSTGRTIVVKVYNNGATNGLMEGLIGGVTVEKQGATSSISWASVTLIVPNGSTYRVNITNGSITGWLELR